MNPESNSAFLALDPIKQDIVRDLRNTVVLAGPGSGKTATLAVKAAYLLTDVIRAPRGVACITYGREAASEFTTRLRGYGIRPTHRLFLGTIHAFCLGAVLRPLGLLEVSGTTRRVVTSSEIQQIIAAAIVDEDSQENPDYFETTMTRIRRATACGEPLDEFSAEHQAIAKRYEDLLMLRGSIDFEGLVLEALRALRDRPKLLSVLAARFPWLLVDEYQDLGGPLHMIVRLLIDTDQVNAFVVGDPDQSIYGFTGADPKYLIELSSSDRFVTYRLEFNYRAGSRLIEVSEAVASPSGIVRYRPDPNRLDPGEIYLERVPGGLTGQSRHVVESILPQLVSDGLPLHEIAVMYPWKLSRTPDVPQALVAMLDAAQVPYAFERETRFRGNPFVAWLRYCASWALSPLGSSDFAGCLGPYEQILASCQMLDDERATLAQRADLLRALRLPADPVSTTATWLSGFADSLRLSELLRTGDVREDDAEVLQMLIDRGVTSVADFAAHSRTDGRLVISTYHASKGRQFDAVILPWLQQGVLPRESWRGSGSGYGPIGERQLAEERRLLYVALTRARRYVFFVMSEDSIDARGRQMPVSSFVSEIESRTMVH